MLQVLLIVTSLLRAAPVPIDLLVLDAAHTHHLDPHVLKALLLVESRLDPTARSRFGHGIAQMTPAGVRGVNRLRERAGRPGDFSMVAAMTPALAIPAAAELLAAFRRSCGGLAPGLAGYNAGFEHCRAVRRHGALGAGRRGFRGARPGPSRGTSPSGSSSRGRDVPRSPRGGRR